MVRYKNLFFDLDDTLWDTAANSRDSLSEAFVYCRLDRFFPGFEEFSRLYSAHNEQLWADYAVGKIDKDRLNFERFAHRRLMRMDAAASASVAGRPLIL